ncbi:hypothetical protein [Aquimarina sp. 2201CG14-23]|uniref:hypothetical protein n=1 Tax=Aquimarina mycalae TaxID=3040073 RepID=UPI002478295D|nr:hypothetical protein [Aquimarina sp. 2201CG14-23]MDH7446201.1 hypothetical protein [Aquimarina sp. 2201CG14-23]
MSAIDRIYSNKLGISFFWKKKERNTLSKVQLVFRDIGFLLTLNELKDFSDACILAKQSQCCDDCNHDQHCRSLLLRTPSDKIDLALNKEELDQVQELINGTIFRIELEDWVKNVGLN